MKKFLLIIGLFALTVSATFAQDIDFVETGDEINFNSNELYISCGTPSMASIVTPLFTIMFTAGTVVPEISKGTYSGGYNYYFNEHWAVGGNITYEKVSSKPSLSFQAKGTAQYGWTHFKFYHALSIGIMSIGTTCNPIFDVIPLGMKLDYNDFNIFVETSIISTGLLKIGASYKF